MAERKRKGLLFDEVLPRAKRTAQSLLSLDPQEDVPASQQALEMALGFVPGVGQAMALRDIERARRAEDPAAAAMAAASFIPFGRLLGRGNAGPIMSELDVYHGTPHRFPATEANPLGEFDASKIGTGEGAQAYGHGVYLAEAPEVAEGYKKTISQSMTAGAQRRLQDAGGDLDKAIADTEAKAAKYRQGGAKSYAEVAEEDLRGLRQFKEAGEWTSGSLYKADLPDEMIDRMLDWDKPLSEQPAAVRESLRKLGKEHPLMFGPPDKLWKFRDAINDPNLTGAQIHKQFEDLFGSQKVSGALMRQAGIPGIKYLDAGSRGQGGSGTRNFVVFPGEEKKVRILERK
jgi:hypothetical protein